MPKKALVRSMSIWNSIKSAADFGITVGTPVLDWSKVMERKNRLIGGFVGNKGPYLEKMGVELVMGQARFISPDKLQIGEETYTAGRFLIGTGSESVLPSIEGVEHGITSKELLFMDKLPQSMVVIGGGIIAMEFAHILASAGTKVTLIQRGDRVLKSEDRDTSKVIQEISKKLGIDILLHSDLKKIELDENNQRIVHIAQPNGDTTVTSEVVLIATGRKPAVEGLDLNNAGIEYSSKGIIVNEFLQTANQKVYAAGDSIGGYMFTPIAALQAKVAVRNALKGNKENPNYKNMTKAIFTLPPVGSVGLTEEEVKESGIDYAVGTLPYTHSGTAILLGETEGQFKVIIDKNTQQIIGAHFVGQDADELIHMITLAIKGKLTIQDFVDTIPVHPTLAESLIEFIRSIE
jgi:glutathione reductase (NADPH)